MFPFPGIVVLIICKTGLTDQPFLWHGLQHFIVKALVSKYLKITIYWDGISRKNPSLLGQNFHLKGMLQNIFKQLLRHNFTAIANNACINFNWFVFFRNFCILSLNPIWVDIIVIFRWNSLFYHCIEQEPKKQNVL